MVQLRRVLVPAVALAGCAAPTGGGGADDRTSIVIGAGSEQETLNPILGYAPDGASKTFDGLVAPDDAAPSPSRCAPPAPRPSP